LAGAERFLFLAQNCGGELSMMHDVAIPEMKKCLGNQSAFLDKHVIGGLFGGYAIEISKIYTQYELLLTNMLQQELLGTEENILTLLYFQNQSYFSLRTFESWHHEDSLEGLFKPEAIPFYRIFEA